MPIKDKRLGRDQTGFTLLEVIVSLLIISVVLLSFFYLFMNATVSTKKTKEILDATYYAQNEMEHLFLLSQSIRFQDRDQAITHVPELTDETAVQYEAKKKYYYSKIMNSSKYERQGNSTKDPYNNYYYELTCEALPLNLTKISVKLYDHKGGVLKAQMESIYEWR